MELANLFLAKAPDAAPSKTLRVDAAKPFSIDGIFTDTVADDATADTIAENGKRETDALITNETHNNRGKVPSLPQQQDIGDELQEDVLAMAFLPVTNPAPVVSNSSALPTGSAIGSAESVPLPTRIDLMTVIAERGTATAAQDNRAELDNSPAKASIDNADAAVEAMPPSAKSGAIETAAKPAKAVMADSAMPSIAQPAALATATAITTQNLAQQTVATQSVAAQGVNPVIIPITGDASRIQRQPTTSRDGSGRIKPTDIVSAAPATAPAKAPVQSGNILIKPDPETDIQTPDMVQSESEPQPQSEITADNGAEFSVPRNSVASHTPHAPVPAAPFTLPGSQPIGTGATPADNSPAPLPQATTPVALDSQFADRIAREIAMISKTAQGISLQVTPERLGTINIEIMPGDNGDTVRLTAEDAEVRQIILQTQSRIEQDMRQSGQKIASFEVAGDGVSNSSGQRQDDAQREAAQQGRAHQPQPPYGTATGDTTATQAGRDSVGNDSRIRYA
ncbi:MAG: flagellar hook-length control protein FliK [Pseudomonadota bacterium]